MLCARGDSRTVSDPGTAHHRRNRRNATLSSGSGIWTEWRRGTLSSAGVLTEMPSPYRLLEPSLRCHLLIVCWSPPWDAITLSSAGVLTEMPSPYRLLEPSLRCNHLIVRWNPPKDAITLSSAGALPEMQSPYRLLEPSLRCHFFLNNSSKQDMRSSQRNSHQFMEMNCLGGWVTYDILVV